MIENEYNTSFYLSKPHSPTMSFQVRYNGICDHYKSLKDAREAWTKNKDIWKISFEYKNES